MGSEQVRKGLYASLEVYLYNNEEWEIGVYYFALFWDKGLAVELVTDERHIQWVLEANQWGRSSLFNIISALTSSEDMLISQIIGILRMALKNKRMTIPQVYLTGAFDDITERLMTGGWSIKFEYVR